jgi:hypothetical protein
VQAGGILGSARARFCACGKRFSLRALSGFPGASAGVDYKHIFFGSVVAMHLSPDMDLLTVRLSVPIR